MFRPLDKVEHFKIFKQMNNRNVLWNILERVYVLIEATVTLITSSLWVCLDICDDDIFFSYWHIIFSIKLLYHLLSEYSLELLFDSKNSIQNENKKYRSLLASTSQSSLLIHICEVEINSQIKRKISFGIQIFYWFCCLLLPLYLYLLFFLSSHWL